ncbi:hypothetical protein LAUMK13_05562 [Mycobacterium innocens]|uniref:Uncharacterized protein n=2 Tax=Mycobacterium innocens TaxID=2341083 RepID=A0A498QHX2_9MYCO|nr:hypothetical protein LAUMK13_05562 [Mycobacterium innocens]
MAVVRGSVTMTDFCSGGLPVRTVDRSMPKAEEYANLAPLRSGWKRTGASPHTGEGGEAEVDRGVAGHIATSPIHLGEKKVI